MSQQRFVRCPHCSLPHEARETRCPQTGHPLERRRPPKSSTEPPGPHDWAHPVATWPENAVLRDLDPSDLEAFVGTVVDGRYRIEALIGRGGMGVVFQATDEHLAKPVAIKILYRSEVDENEAEHRFLHEARVASSLGHPHIVEVFDFGHLDDGCPFQVMELLTGESLATHIERGGALHEVDVLAIAEQLLSALAAAHQRGVVHRDLKPENVFLQHGDEGLHVKLLDFGVSKSLGESGSVTMTGVVVGTPYYLSPEQARGLHDVDHRSDLWALGVLMYEALTGVLPFNASDYQGLLHKIIRSRPVPPSKFRAHLDPGLEAIVLGALATDRDERPPSARAMLELLREIRPSRGRAPSADRFQYSQLASRPPDDMDPDDTEVSSLPAFDKDE